MIDQPVAIVTGGTRGIGAAISKRLLKDGFKVIAAFRGDAASAQRLEREVDDDHFTTRQADVTSAEACAGLVASALTSFRRLDVLVNNAGGVVDHRPEDIREQEWNDALRLNLTSAFLMSKEAIEPMTVAKYGRIVNISSVAATLGSPFQVDYAAAKAGLIGMTRSLARSVARSGITVNCVLPGAINTDLNDGLTLTPSAAIAKSVPVGRFGEPDEVAHVVSSLVHANASYVTGVLIAVDGGLSMGN
jgi:NAD(P)-dependent dehydrogenase (short-subunit alcohol dehydrogenase family)